MVWHITRDDRAMHRMTLHAFDVPVLTFALIHRVKRLCMAVDAQSGLRFGGVWGVQDVGWHMPDPVAVAAVAHTHSGAVPGMAVDAHQRLCVQRMTHITRQLGMFRMLSRKRLFDD